MPDNGSIVGPNEPMTENFKKTPYASLVREAIQNSLDERLDKTKPLEMNFSIKKLSLERFPNFREIHQHNTSLDAKIFPTKRLILILQWLSI